MSRTFDLATQQNQTQGLNITRPLQSGSIGSFYALVLVTIGTSDTTLSHELGRKPSGYLVARNQGGGIVHDGTANGTDWTASAIVLRASVSGLYSLLLC